MTRAGATSIEDFVILRDHDVGSVDPVPLRTEHEVCKRLVPTTIPVAEVLWLEDDPA